MDDESDNEWEPPKPPDVQQILDEAQLDYSEGRYQAAWKKHVWFHEHALEHRPSISGVRTSFALAYWNELGKVYPPARTKMVQARDEAESKVLEGVNLWESFQDFASLNRTLGQESSTAKTFQKLCATDVRAAEQVYHLAQPALVESRAYELCNQFIDPQRDYASIKRAVRVGRELAKIPQIGPRHLDYVAQRFSNGVRTLVALLVVNHRYAEAEKVARRARKLSHNPLFLQELEIALVGQVPDS